MYVHLRVVCVWTGKQDSETDRKRKVEEREKEREQIWELLPIEEFG